MVIDTRQGPVSAKVSSDRDQRFVAGVFKLCNENKGAAARLRRADNPGTEYQSWEVLASYGVDLELERERLPFSTIAAAIAKSKAQTNGTLTLGRTIAACYEKGKDSDQAKARLSRLLACDDLNELCRLLRPLLSLVNSKLSQPLDYERLLRQLRRFAYQPQVVKAQWASDFYGQAPLNHNGEAA
jgi:CRISPR system Cascade subunit CasB